MKQRGKKSLTAVLAAALFVTSVPAASFAFSETKGAGAAFVPVADTAVETVKREYILTADSDLRGLKLPAYVAEMTFADRRTALLHVKGGVTMEQIRRDFGAQTTGLLVQPNYVYEAARVNDPYYSLQWGLHGKSSDVQIRFDDSYGFIRENLRDMTDTVVAVIDTGVDYTHPDLAENMWTNPNDIAGNGRDDDGNGYIDDIHGYDFVSDSALHSEAISSEYDHGTHCAGTIGAVSGNGIGISGIAAATGAVSIMDLKVLAGKNGTGDTFDLIQAIRYAEKNGADICNLSMGSYAYDQTLFNTIASSEMLFVCAAGNAGVNLESKPIYPGCFDLDNVICVANGNRSGQLNSLSNYSSRYADLAAPGTDIYSTLAQGRYGNMSGTSMAAPYVSGAAAVLHSYYKDISAAEMRFLLLDGAAAQVSLDGKVAGNRFLDLYKPLTSYNHEDFHIDRKAPVLKSSISKIKGSYKQRLNVSAVDDSGRLSKVRYARGSQSLTYFRSGMGAKLKPDDDGTVRKTLSVPGIYTVYAADAAGNDTIRKVRCTADAVSFVKLNYSSKSIAKGKKYTLKATLSKSGKYGRKLTWTSSDKSVATVSSKGTVTGKKKGTATVTVKTSNGLSKSCKIVVK